LLQSRSRKEHHHFGRTKTGAATGCWFSPHPTNIDNPPVLNIDLAKIFAKKIQDFGKNFCENHHFPFLQKSCKSFAKIFAKFDVIRFYEHFHEKFLKKLDKKNLPNPINLFVFLCTVCIVDRWQQCLGEGKASLCMRQKSISQGA
jgi:inhibitor of KinA sporulation pathway (predicted exonuclease)